MLLSGVNEINTSEVWRDFLVILLNLGNIMNVDQSNGSAFGFDLKSITEFEKTRSLVKIVFFIFFIFISFYFLILFLKKR